MTLGRVVIVGRGRVGRALFVRLREALEAERSADEVVDLVRARGLSKLCADTVVLAVPDASLGPIALVLAADGALAPVGRKPPVVLHVSGIRDASVLAPLGEAGASVGAMHPLVSFARATQPPKLAGSAFAVAGDLAARRRAVALARRLGATPVTGRAGSALQGAAYHAAAALLANGAAALAADASAILAALGVGRRARARALAGLLRSVADNVAAVGTPGALTGPIVRGDASAVALHLAALSRSQRAAYVAAARLVLPVAVEAGLPAPAARTIRALLDRADAPGRPRR